MGKKVSEPTLIVLRLVYRSVQISGHKAMERRGCSRKKANVSLQV